MTGRARQASTSGATRPVPGVGPWGARTTWHPLASLPAADGSPGAPTH